MNKFLIIIPGPPGPLLINGWSVILQALINKLPNTASITIATAHPFFSNKNCVLARPPGTNLAKAYKQFSIFTLLKRALFALIFSHPLQSAFFTPDHHNNHFLSLYSEADTIIFITSRTLNYNLLDFVQNRHEKLHICLLIDFLSLAFSDHSKNSRNFFCGMVSRRESSCLHKLESRIISTMPSGLVNPNDISRLLPEHLNHLIFRIPMNITSFPSIDDIKQQKSCEYINNKVIYILGNQEYLPNWQSTLRLLDLFSTFNSSTLDILSEHDIRFKLVGHLTDSRFMWLSKHMKQRLSFIPFSICKSPSSLDFIKYDGLSTLSAVETAYGAQSKEVTSISSLLPIMAYSSDRDPSDSPLWKLNFYDQSTFISCLVKLLNPSSLTLLKQTMLNTVLSMDAEHSTFVRKLFLGMI